MRSATGSASWTSSGRTSSSQARDLPLPTLRILDLARALAAEPDVLLLDEITAALPADLAERVFAVARELESRDRAVIFISHRLAEVVRPLRPRDRAARRRHRRRRRSGPGQRGADRQLMLGADGEGGRRRRGMRRSAADAPGADAEHVLEVRGLLRRDRPRRGQLRAPRRRGPRRRGARGPGPGRALRVPRRRAAGRRGRDRGPRPGADVPRTRPTRSAPASCSFPPIACRRCSRSGRCARTSPRRSTAACAAGGRSSCGPSGDASTRRSSGCRSTRGPRARSRRLSGGNQQKVTIARWLAAGFETILCFDPTRGIDVGTKRQIYALLRELAEAGDRRPALHLRAAGDPARLRPRRRALRGRGRRRAGGREADEATLLRAAHGLPRSVIEAAVI